MRIYVCTLLLKFDAKPIESITASGHGVNSELALHGALFSLFDNLTELEMAVVDKCYEDDYCINKIRKASAMPANEAVEMLRTIGHCQVAEFYNVV